LQMSQDHLQMRDDSFANDSRPFANESNLICK
jgi:hypothetical protein